MFRKKTVIFLGLLVSSIFFFTIYVLLTVLPGQENEIKTVSSIEKAIYNELNKLPEVYHTSGANSDNTKFYTFFNNVKKTDNIRVNESNLTKLWQEANSWTLNTQLVNISSPDLGKLIFAMKNAKIIKADIDSRGTQLKLLLTLKVI